MIGNFLKVLTFNVLFLKLNRFICVTQWLVLLIHQAIASKHLIKLNIHILVLKSTFYVKLGKLISEKRKVQSPPLTKLR